MHAKDRIPSFNDFLDGLIDSMGNKAPAGDDPIPWCSDCGAMRKSDCRCGTSHESSSEGRSND